MQSTAIVRCITAKGDVRQCQEAGTPVEHPAATIVRDVLLLPASGVERQASSALLDISGRNVLDLAPGANDVSRLAPGIYLVRSASGGERSAVGKVVIQR